MVYRSFRLIGKYALMISIIYAVEKIAWEVINLSPYANATGIERGYLYYVSYAVSILFNILIAVVINRDIKKYKLKTNYVLVATLLFRPVGVCAFLLYSLQDEYKGLANEGQIPGNTV